MKYEPSDLDRARIERDFSYHVPKTDQLSRYIEIRDLAKAYAGVLMMNCPPSREQSLALTALEECVMWANASIARNE